MGSPPSEAGRKGGEDQVDVTFTQGYWLGKYEVTQSEWKAIMKTEPWKAQDSTKEGADVAATFVSWDAGLSHLILRLTGEDLKEEVVVPATHLPFTADAIFSGVLLDQEQCEPIQESQILGAIILVDATAVFAEAYV